MTALRRLLCAAAVPLSASLFAACTPREAPAPHAPPAAGSPSIAVVDDGTQPPLGPLPGDVKPLDYQLTLQIDPEKDHFSGTARIIIDLSAPRSTLWMHARDLRVKSATIQPDVNGALARASTCRACVLPPENQPVFPARFEQVDPTGVAKLSFEQPIPKGWAILVLDYEGPLPEGNSGLYRVRRGGRAYAFTQFEATSARQAFPSFDEPAFKTPFHVNLIVPRDHTAISSGAQVNRVRENDQLDRVTFATTQRLPTYLLAFAVGPFDVVKAPSIPPSIIRHRELPLRGVAVAGRGSELAFALANTGSLIQALEDYTGLPYPFDKLDLIAVPGKHGAMENAGAVTFSEYLLLMDAVRSPARQRRAFFDVGAHEFAHMWFGDLVTMPWWNDLWLKEASANWLGTRAVRMVYPALDLESEMLSDVHRAMNTDSLLAARKIRQEIDSHHDISNAFDGITYDKGYGVISMFERWLGPEVYQRAVRSFFMSRMYGTASADDYLAALGQAASRDVATPMRTFLDQPGVPLVKARLTCEGKPRLRLEQSRYLPLGSAGAPAAQWQIPICARYPRGQGADATETTCTLLDGREGEIQLASEQCPAWVLPNADGVGYFRWTLPSADLQRLITAGLAHLSVREKMSLAANIHAAFAQGTTSGKEALTLLAPLATDARHEVATAPIPLLQAALQWLAGGPSHARVEAYARALYAPAYRSLGWGPRAAGPGATPQPEPEENSYLRTDVLRFLALDARDPQVRKEAAARGRAYIAGGTLHPETVAPELAGIVVAAALQQGDAALFEQALAALASTEHDVPRGVVLFGLGSIDTPELATRVRELVFDARVRPHEIYSILSLQLEQPAVRDAAWSWFEQKLDAILQRLSHRHKRGLIHLAASLCDSAYAGRVEALFTPRIAGLEGGPRVLAGTVETIKLCAARKKAQQESLNAFFETSPRVPHQ
ncbi:M1 family metallopeptidase [Chondromyces crocatus]|uniref:Aminopeptidase n=1 Tax=Chondromyces crocatus TaxID=52 RepID=A0A0K1EP26_CHOCO|nr:M1 family metallopeptidase [Chondromyces crocatus]AKT42559.1 aminopeptidase N [Chondromyces crocatus]